MVRGEEDVGVVQYPHLVQARDEELDHVVDAPDGAHPVAVVRVDPARGLGVEGRVLGHVLRLVRLALARVVGRRAGRLQVRVEVSPPRRGVGAKYVQGGEIGYAVLFVVPIIVSSIPPYLGHE